MFVQATKGASLDDLKLTAVLLVVLVALLVPSPVAPVRAMLSSRSSAVVHRMAVPGSTADSGTAAHLVTLGISVRRARGNEGYEEITHTSPVAHAGWRTNWPLTH